VAIRDHTHGPATCEENSGVICAIEGCFFPASDKSSISERARNGVPAIDQRRPRGETIIHSDQGTQFSS
jgi:hypothetical protein